MSATLTASATELVDVDAIVAGDNDRKTFRGDELAELAASIGAHGLAQPPTVRPVGDRFEIVAGERRIRAMRDVLGWSAIPCQVRDLDDHAAAAIMLAENVQRTDLDPIEEARAYQSRIDRFGSTVQEVAGLANVSVNRVRSRIALLRLTDAVAHLVATKALPLRFAGLMVDLDANRQRLAIAAYNERPLSFETFAAICSRLQLEQDQEVMFDASSFLQVEDYLADAEASTAVDEPSTVDEMDADPVGAKDIAERLGVKPQTVAMWRYRGLLPEPRWTVSDMPVWQWSDIEAWHKARKGQLK